MEIGNCGNNQVQCLASSFATHKTELTGSSIPKRFWNLQNVSEIQQRKKVGPYFSEISSKNDKTRCSMDVEDLSPIQYNNTEAENEHMDQEQKNGLRRKAAKGLKRIITHLSLSDVNSLSGTPGLTSTSLSHHYHHQPPFNHDEENEHSMTSSEETSLDTLSTENNMHEVDHEEGPEQKKNTLGHYQPSRSHSAFLMLSNITSLANRSLPPLPSAKLSTSLNVKNHALDEYHHLKEKVHQVHVEEKFRQAIHWCRKPFHKFISSPIVSTITPSSSQDGQQLGRSQLSLVSVSSSSSSFEMNTTATDSILASHRERYTYNSKVVQDNQRQQPWAQESARFNRKKVLRCRVIQITNIASSKEYQYELYVQLNGNIQASQSGIMKKITKGISAASPKESFSFEVNGPFSLEFTLCAKPIDSGLLKMKTLISKMDLAHYQLEQPSSSSAFQNNDENSTNFPSTMPVVGSTYLLSGEKFEAFSGKGLSRYTLIKPLGSKHQKQLDELNLELMIAFQLEDLVPSEPIGIPGICTNGIDLDAAVASCHQGDYLTFYVRRQQFPTWNRYWVTLGNGQLYLRQFSNEHKNPIESIPLCELQYVCKPGEEIQEQVYFGRKHGIVLKFKTKHIQMGQVTLAEDEHLNGYMYLFADSPQKASIWQSVFTAYASTEYAIPNPSINARYLW